MTVDVEGKRGGSMAEIFLHCFDVVTVLEAHNGIRVSDTKLNYF